MARSLALTLGIGSRSLQPGTWIRVENIRSDCVPLRESVEHISQLVFGRGAAVNRRGRESKQVNAW